jgi:hypothetical protein
LAKVGLPWLASKNPWQKFSNVQFAFQNFECDDGPSKYSEPFSKASFEKVLEFFCDDGTTRALSVKA